MSRFLRIEICVVPDPNSTSGTAAALNVCRTPSRERSTRTRRSQNRYLNCAAPSLSLEMRAGASQRCSKLSPIVSIMQYRFATPKPLKTRRSEDCCGTAPLRN